MKFGVSNLRRLHHVDPVDMKPITILVGRNSGGKSTFLRSLPLVRQSLQTRTGSPILWFGDLVDFGTLEESLSKPTQSESVAFAFEDDVTTHETRGYYRTSSGFYHHRNNQREVYKRLRYKVEIAPFQNKNRISRISVGLDHEVENIDLTFNDSGSVQKALIAGRDASSYLDGQRLYISTDDIFPVANFARKRSTRDTAVPWWGFPGDEMSPAVFTFLRDRIDRRVKDHTLQWLAERLIISGLPNSQTVTAAISGQGKIVRGRISEIISQGGDDYTYLLNLLSIANIPTLFRDISEHFRRILGSTLYIGPARARSERYYRYQDLAVNEIDPDGKNFPIFLNSLSKARQDSFSNWVQSLYGYSVSVSQRSGHISITLTDRDVAANIVDVGYGISQILPVLGQVWWARERLPAQRSQRLTPILAIEQPELHLHPAHQAILADAFVEVLSGEGAGSKNSPVRFLIETHSETLINRLGKLVARGEIAAEDIHIAIFEAGESGAATTVRTAEFNSKGALVDWPYGFFQPDQK